MRAPPMQRIRLLVVDAKNETRVASVARAGTLRPIRGVDRIVAVVQLETVVFVGAVVRARSAVHLLRIEVVRTARVQRIRPAVVIDLGFG